MIKNIFVCENAILGKLTVVRLIDDITQLPDTVPLSYRQHGRVWQCRCECGTDAYYSEFVLSRGKVKSCGCLRRGTALAWREKQFRKSLAHDTRAQIRERQKALKDLQWDLKNGRGDPRDEDRIGVDLRALFTKLNELGFKR